MTMETWYIMADGSIADPREVSPDEGGILHHVDGRAVAYAGHGPRARMISAEEIEAYRTREMKPEASKRAYKTRAAKAGD